MADGSHLLRISGAGGGGGGGSEAANDLQARSLARIIDLISEGPIVGIVDPETLEPDREKGTFYNDTPVKNADDSYNFPGSRIIEKTGSAGQTPIPDFPAAETAVVLGSQVVQATPVVRRITDLDVNRARIGLRIPALYKVSDKGDMTGAQVNITISVKADATDGASEYVQIINDIVVGKTLSPYERAYQVELPGVGPWDIKVTRVSADDASSKISSVTTFQYLTEIISASIAYADRAVIGQVFDAQQFAGNIPTRTFLAKGRIVKVPSNYNAATRVYTGEWDGTFIDAYCNNPVWIAFDLLINTRYGVGDWITEDDIELSDFYVASQFCDEMVNDGKGGTEPRVTMNVAIVTQEEAIAVLQTVFGTFRSSLIWGGEKFSVMTNKPKAVSKIFTRANVKDGQFNYQGTSLDARHTVAEVSWTNPDLGYKNDIMVVEHPLGIERYQYNVLKVSAVGCTSPGQAMRVGLMALYSEFDETDAVSFQAGIRDAGITLGSVIGIADPIFTDKRHGGLLAAVTDTTHITLDSPYTFDIARTYNIQIMRADGTMGNYDVVNPGTGDHTALVLSDALEADNMPIVSSVWTLTDDIITTRKWYVVGLQEGDGDEWIKVMAIQYEIGKFDAIDAGVILPIADTPYADTGNPAVCEPAANLRLDYRTRTVGNALQGEVVASWEASPDRFIRGYKVSFAWGTDTVRGLPEQKNPGYTFDTTRREKLTVWVGAVNQFGVNAIPIASTIDLSTSDATGKNLITDLQILGGGTSWKGRNIPIEWKSLPTTADLDETANITTGQDQEFQNFVVQVYDKAPGSGGVLLGAVSTTLTNYTVTYDQLMDWGLIQRSYYFRVALLDANSNTSNFAVATFTNPAPELPIVTAKPGPGATVLSFVDPIDPDFAGIIVWASNTSGFTAGSGNEYWRGHGRPVIYGTPGSTVYYRFAGFDAWGDTGLNVSTEQSTVLGDVEATTIGGHDVDEILDGLASNSLAIAQNLLADAVYRAGRDALLWVDGEAVGGIATRADEVSADGAQSFALLGDRTDSDTTFTLHVDKVKIPIDGTGASAISLMSLRTQHDQNVADVNFLVSSTGGVYAQATLTTTVDGYVTGFKFWNGGSPTNSGFTIVSGDFAIIDPGNSLTTAFVPFQVTAGVVRMLTVEVDTFTAGSVVTDSLQDNSVSAELVSFITTNNPMNSSFAYESQDSGTFTKATTVNSLEIEFIAEVAINSGLDVGYDAKVLIDGSAVGPVFHMYLISPFAASMIGKIFVTGLSAGSHTWDIQFRVGRSSSGATNAEIRNSYTHIREIKK